MLIYILLVIILILVVGNSLRVKKIRNHLVKQASLEEMKESLVRLKEKEIITEVELEDYLNFLAKKELDEKISLERKTLHQLKLSGRLTLKEYEYKIKKLNEIILNTKGDN